MKTTVYIVAIGLAVIGGLYFLGSKAEGPQDGKLDAFALCLTEKNMIMYGAAWCSHCKVQKGLFGASFSKVSYVECPDNEKFCLDKGIKGYPTWITADGTKFSGTQSLEKLAQISGCELPKN